MRNRAHTAVRARATALAVALLAAACGGGAPALPTTASPTPVAGPSLDPVILTPATFSTLVLGSPSTCLVEFQRPT